MSSALGIVLSYRILFALWMCLKKAFAYSRTPSAESSVACILSNNQKVFFFIHCKSFKVSYFFNPKAGPCEYITPKACLASRRLLH